MIETILIATDRKTGKDVLLVGREVPFREQLEAYKKLAAPVNEDYSDVNLATVQPHKRPLKFATKSELEAREKANKEAIEVAEKAAKKAEKKSEKETAQAQADAKAKHEQTLADAEKTHKEDLAKLKKNK